MRAKMRAHRRAPRHGYDAKHGSGGIIDAEFIAQYLVLSHARRHRELARNLGTSALLRIAAELKLLPHGLAHETAGAYRELRRLQHLARLDDRQETLVPPEVAAELTRAPQALWQATLQGVQ